MKACREIAPKGSIYGYERIHCDLNKLLVLTMINMASMYHVIL